MGFGIRSGVLVCTLLSVALRAQPPLPLVRGGTGAAGLVVAGDAPATVRRAAREFRHYVRESTGADLPILVDRRPLQGVSVFVGPSRFTRELGVEVPGPAVDGYRWRTGDDWVAIVGRDHHGPAVCGMRNPWLPHEVHNPELELGAFGEAGTLIGTYHFLERFLGVRWFMPGALGTVVPRHSDMVIPELDLLRAPDFEYRYPWFCNFSTAPDDALWYRRVGFGGACPVQAIDSFRMFLPHKDEHPEWFALVDGERDFDSRCCVTGGGQLCLSNRDLMQQMAVEIREYFDQHPEQRFFPVAPNDGMTRVCECPECAALVREGRGPEGRFSDYIWGFVNRLAGEVAQTHPQRFLGTIAYEGYLDPPDAIERLHPNVAVMICQTRGTFADPDRRREARERIAAWARKTDRIYLWEYYRDNLPPFPWCPTVYPHLIQENLSELRGVSRGEFIEAESWLPGGEARIHYPAMQHLNLYVTAKCLWDADLDVDALLDDYCTSFYGPAAGPMREFWERAEALHRERPLADPVGKYPVAEVDALLGILERARAAAEPDTDCDRRVAAVQEDLVRLRQALGSPLVTRIPELTACRTDAGLEIDGRLREDVWLVATPMNLVRKNGEAPEHHTWLAAAHDHECLYLGVLCFEPHMDALRTTTIPGGNTDGIWDDDCVEVFIAPQSGNPEKAFQLIVNAAGAVWDGAYGLPEPGPGLFGCQPGWDCAGLRAGVHRGERAWSVELGIPWEALGLSGDSLPQDLALNVYRCRNVGQEPVRTAWSPPLRVQHYTPERFGRVRLAPGPVPLADTDELLPRSEEDVGSGAAAGPGWYSPGGVLDGKPFVGNPNTLVRRDRMVIRFALSPLILRHAGAAPDSALLRLTPLSVAGTEPVRDLELVHFEYDTAPLGWKDVVDPRVSEGRVERVAREHVDRGQEVVFDVTDFVQADLAQGRPTSAFRIRDVDAEKGNPDMEPDGVCFPDYRSGRLRLELQW